MRWPALRAFAALAVLVLPAAGGCGRDGGAQATGTVHGQIVAAGGPRHPFEDPLAGTVTARTGGRTIASQRVAAGAEYGFYLPPGRYRIEATSGDARCRPVDVIVHGTADQRVDVVCSLK